MFITQSITIERIVALAFALLVSNTVLAAPIARATFVIGSAQIKAASGDLKPLAQGAELNSGESVITSPRSAVQLLFVDQTRVAIRPSSEIAIDQFNYSAQDNSGGSDSMILRLARGALRSVTGLIGTRNKQHFALNTPIATIGIRGTDFEAIHVPEVGGYGDDKSIPPGTYNKVYTGGTSLTTKAGVIDLKINETGFVGGKQNELTTPPIKIAQLPLGITNVINSAPIPGAMSDKPTSSNNEKSSTAANDSGSPTNQNAPNQSTDGGPKPDASSGTPVADTPAPTGSPSGDGQSLKNVDPSKLKAISPALNDLKAATLSDPSTVQPLQQIDPSALKLDSSQLKSLPTATLQTIAPATLQTIAPATLQTIAPATLQTIAPATLQTIAPATLQTIAPATLQTIAPATLQTIAPATLQTIAPATLQTVAPATLQTVAPATLQTVAPATLQTVAPATLQTVAPATLQTVAPATLQTAPTTLQLSPLLKK